MLVRFSILGSSKMENFETNFLLVCLRKCSCSLCTHQVPLKHLRTAMLRLLGGPWLGLHGLSGHYVGPHGCSNSRIVTKSSPKPNPGAAEGFRKNSNFDNFSGVTKQATQQPILGLFRGAWLGLHGHSGHYRGDLHVTNGISRDSDVLQIWCGTSGAVRLNKRRTSFVVKQDYTGIQDVEKVSKKDSKIASFGSVIR